MISRKKKFIFIHIPRNGGTSVNFALKQFCINYPEEKPGVHKKVPAIFYKHASIKEICKSSQIKCKSFFKFTTVRNPWDRILSLYFWGIYIYPMQSFVQEKDFNSWVKNVFMYQEICEKFRRTQFDYISIDSKIKMDYIMRFENLQNDWLEVCKRLGIKVELPIIYKTDHENYTHYYNSESRRIIEKIFAIDIEHFGYQYS